MAARLRLPTLALATLSIGLNLAILGCSSRALDVYNSEVESNAYFLPVWHGHFDTRELSALIGTSVIIVILNGLLLVSLLVPSLPANLIIFTTTILSTTISIIGLAFSSYLNNSSSKATLQSWTCSWRDVSNENVPRQFDTLCHETRFAFYTTIPSFLIQLSLLGLAIYAVIAGTSSRGMRMDEEKDHELRSVRQESFDTKSEPTRIQILAGKR
ncbi:uncharacterized protein RCC_09484 [Ramularia collo-cygni]|uniref:Uncharacterized protein n=1 Tax=Ramularia collo-cygni TaxID=112498 RepID=A0A2D3VA11_9PEZI|nr:uncharacterized protein RCC_09484 [Ramularia collo-cygni]CZT23770.1 uncharacterized protein RCC_09484 [Ramularia collo-cygni]